MKTMVRLLPGVYVASGTDGAYDRRGRYVGEISADCDSGRPTVITDVTSLVDTGSDAFTLGDSGPLLRVLDHIAEITSGNKAIVAALCADLVRSAGGDRRDLIAAAICEVFATGCSSEAVAVLQDFALMAGDLSVLAAVSAA